MSKDEKRMKGKKMWKKITKRVISEESKAVREKKRGSKRKTRNEMEIKSEGRESRPKEKHKNYQEGDRRERRNRRMRERNS